MVVQTVISAALFFIAIGCVIRANLLFGEIVTDVNRLLPKEQAIPVFGFTRHLFFDVLAEYRRLYPNGKLARKFYIWTAIGFACLIGCACYLVFSGVGTAGYIPRHS
jgi:hypothetical protein